MTDQTLPESSITFSGFSVDALECCLEYGAAKLSRIISEDSLTLLRDKGVPQSPALLSTRMPEIEGFLNLLDIRDLEDNKLVVDVIDPYPNIGSVMEAHVDSTARKGVSLLVPYIGSRALFSCDTGPYDINNNPRFQTTYGPGDAILLRQTINSVNHEPRSLNQAWHMGVASACRTLITIDYLSDHIAVRESLTDNK
jgi:hypothetical protein